MTVMSSSRSTRITLIQKGKPILTRDLMELRGTILLVGWTHIILPTISTLPKSEKRESGLKLNWKCIKIQFSNGTVLVPVCHDISLLTISLPHPPLSSIWGFNRRRSKGHQQAARFSRRHLGRTKPWRSSYGGGQGETVIENTPVVDLSANSCW